MAQCETCGNDYDHCLEVIKDGQSHFFDCFECAIQLLAPACAHCECKVIGHGVEREGQIYCCDHCSRHEEPAPEPPQKPATILAEGPQQ